MRRTFLFVIVIALALIFQSCGGSSNDSKETDSTQSEADSKQWTVEKLTANKKQLIDDFEITMTDANRGIKIDDISFENTEVLSDIGYPQFICTIKGAQWHNSKKTSPQPFEAKMFIEDRNGKIEWSSSTLYLKIW